ncbi:MAG: iron chelate uptake ABC transporter family permease subunit [Luteitalea sp.]|nr:iron chelate uptake ABC transporter family permease subunit [Luteitalea sp.]
MLVYGGFGVLAIAAQLFAPLIGSTSISLTRALDGTVPFAANIDAQIFFIARLPRTLAAGLVGASLASAGVMLQALLRNPLAEPFTLGVSAGSSLGAMLAMLVAPPILVLGVSAVPLATFAGAVGAVSIVYGLASARHRGFSTDVLLLTGVTLNAFFSAVILFLQYHADPSETVRTLRWLMGDLDVSGYGPIVVALPLIAAAFVIFLWLPRGLNLLTLGSDSAAARGIDVVRVQRLAFFSASVATGAAVSLAGPIGFVGIVVPHVVRLLVGSDHRLVLPGAALFGAAFLVGCDVVARTIMAPLELPVGIITAVIGGPFFLWLLFRRA